MSSPPSRSDLGAIITTAVGGIGGGTILLASAPVIAVSEGGSTTIAGGLAAAFMGGTLLAQIAMLKLVRLVGFPVGLLAGTLLLTLPCLIGLLNIAPTWWLFICALRGAGFGIVAVIATALPPMLAPTPLVSRVVAMQGVAMSVAQAIGVPGSLALLKAFGQPTMLITAAAVPLVSLAAYPALRRLHPDVHVDTYQFAPRREGRGLLIVACATLCGVGAVYGAATTLVPIGPYASPALVLLFLSLSVIGGRLVAGLGVERWGAGRTLRWAVVMAAAGAALFAWPSKESATLTVVGAVLYGCAFGIVTNDTLLLCYSACGPGGSATASVWWGLSVDGAIGLGPLIFAAMVGVVGFSGTFVVAALSVLACVVLPLTRSRRAVGDVLDSETSDESSDDGEPCTIAE
jgi:hypothetical protein